MSRSDWNSPRKNSVRNMATANLNKGRCAREAIMMPGHQVLCVIKAVKNGLISVNKTILHVVEKKPAIANIIQKRIEKMGWGKNKYHMHNCKLHNVKLPKNAKIEYAFLDTCNPISAKAIRWLHNNQSQFSSTARIGLTFCSHVRRGREVSHEINKALTYTQKCECMRLLLQAEGNWVGETFGLVKKGTIRANELVGWNNQQEIMKAIFAGVFCALSDSLVKPTIAVQYKEVGVATTMHYLEIELSSPRNKQNDKSRFNWIKNIVPKFAQVSASRSAIAKKAWITRRKNQTKQMAA